MGGLKPDTAVYALDRSQPEFSEQLWQYLNRRVSDWRITDRQGEGQGVRGAACAHREGLRRRAIGDARAVGHRIGLRRSGRAEEPHAARDPVARRAGLGRAAPAAPIGSRNCSTRWSSSSAAGARRRRCAAPGPAPWAIPSGCRRCGSISGVDYDGDGRVSPFGKPDDALAGTAQYLVKRGKYRRGEHWGYEVRGAAAAAAARRVAQLRGVAESRRRTRRRPAIPAAQRDREALGAGAGRPGASCSGRISMPCAPTTRR